MVEWKKYSHKSEVKWTVDGLMLDIDHHTKTKHLLLESYLQDWVETLTGNCKIGTGQVTLVDGFCGGGIYRDGDDYWEGSPIRMIRAVEAGWRSVKERKPYQDLNIAYLFVDAQREHTECLKYQIREAGYGELLDSGRCRVVTGDFEDQLEDCLSWVKQRGGHSFFFLDPFGLADLPGMSRAILSLGRSEVLLNHMQHDGFMRPMGWHRSRGSIETFLEKYGFANHYDWCKEIDKLSTLKQQALLHDSALRLYRECSAPRFAWTFAFMRNPNTVYYYLIHLSNKPTAVSVMRRTLWKYNNLDYQFHYGIFGLGYRTLDDLNQNLQLLDIHQRNSQACQEKLREQLERFMFAQKALQFRKLFEGTVEQHPATREDYMGVIHQMVLDGDLEIIREERSRCTSRIFNKDIIRKSEAKQLVLLSDRTSERIPRKRRASRTSSASKHVTALETSLTSQSLLFPEFEL
ncbi:hypothetical protein C7B76_05205 [filamentous cyanobacterium CCP2]|nr:hypothetical protein C7B76_05205 [filamentous cyanobacterium CCP2]